MSRREQAEQTRSRILDSAVEVLFELGYAGTSTLEIQRRAGLSRGGLLHQFASRDDLLIAAVQHLATTRVAALTHQRDWPRSERLRIDAAVEEMWRQYQQPYFWVSVELWLAARHNPSVASALGPRERELAVLVRASTTAFFGESLAARPGFADLAELLTTSMRGVGVAYSLTPDRDPGTDPHLAQWKRFARIHLRT